VALREAIEAIEALGVPTIQSRIDGLVERVIDGVPDDRLLSPSPPESGLVTVDVDRPAETVTRLADHGIVVRSLPHPDAVRASIHAVNTAEEVESFVDALDEEW
jgi:selenocysteine lyase/cysteine desulfurase